jgi:hypothetical protein
LQFWQAPFLSGNNRCGEMEGEVLQAAILLALIAPMSSAGDER